MRKTLLAVGMILACLGCGSGEGYELETPDQLAPDANDAGQVETSAPDTNQPEPNEPDAGQVDAGQADVEEIWDSAGSGWKDGAGPDVETYDVIHIDSPDLTNDAAIDTASETYAPYDDAGIQDTGVQAGTCTTKNRLEVKCVLGGTFGLNGSTMTTVICDGQSWQPARRVSNGNYECLVPCFKYDNLDHSHEACDSVNNGTFRISCNNVQDGYSPKITVVKGPVYHCYNGLVW